MTPKRFACICAMASALVLVTGAPVGADEWRVPKRRARMVNPIAAEATSLESGRKVYAAECESCHGVSGHGDGPEAAKVEGGEVSDLTLPKHVQQSDGTLFWKVTVGRKPMPGFRRKLSDQERWDVINYLRTLMAPAKADTPVAAGPGNG